MSFRYTLIIETSCPSSGSNQPDMAKYSVGASIPLAQNPTLVSASLNIGYPVWESQSLVLREGAPCNWAKSAGGRSLLPLRLAERIVMSVLSDSHYHRLPKCIA